MEYSIKQIAQKVDISEQGLYKRIRTNYEEYLKNGFIVSKPLNPSLETTRQKYRKNLFNR